MTTNKLPTLNQKLLHLVSIWGVLLVSMVFFVALLLGYYQFYLTKINDYFNITQSMAQYAGVMYSGQDSKIFTDIITSHDVGNPIMDISILRIRDIEHAERFTSRQEAKYLNTALFAPSLTLTYPIYTNNNNQQPFTSNDMGSNAVSGNVIGYLVNVIDLHQLRAYWLHLFTWALLSLSIIVLPLFVYGFYRKLQSNLNPILGMDKLNLQQLSKQMALVQRKIDSAKMAETHHLWQLLYDVLTHNQELTEQLNKIKQTTPVVVNRGNYRLSDFQNLMTHELKNSLNAILGGKKLLENQYLTDEQKDAVAVIERGSTHLNFLIDQVIYLNKIEKGQIGLVTSNFKPIEILGNMIAFYQGNAHQKGLRIINKVQHADQVMHGDADKIKQIISILLDNAIKFTNNGSVTIESLLQHFNHSSRWHIKVIDTGIGISSKSIEHLFEPFFQENLNTNDPQSGTGMGLPLAKKLTKLLEGELALVSSSPEGSTFELIVPLYDSQNKRHGKRLQGKNILVFSHIDSTHAVKLWLNECGADVDICHDADTVIAHLMSHYYQAVILDASISTEESKNLAQSIRQRQLEERSVIIKIFSHSNSGSLSQKQRHIQRADIDAMLDETASKEELIALVENWIKM